MLKGKIFNWSLEAPYADGSGEPYATLSVGGFGDMWTCTFLNNELYIYEINYHTGGSKIKIHCGFDMAEKIVLGFVEANKLEIPPLYLK